MEDEETAKSFSNPAGEAAASLFLCVCVMGKEGELCSM